MPRRVFSGGLFPEDRRRRYPAPVEPARDDTAENELRSRILRLLLRSNFPATVTDAKTVATLKGKRRLVYPEGWPDITASIPVTGRAWAIEVKKEGEDLRPSQVEKLAELEAAGWLVTVAEGAEGVVHVNREIKRQLEQIGNRDFQEYLHRLREARSAARSNL